MGSHRSKEVGSPTEGLTTYVPEGATKEQVSKAIEEKSKEVSPNAKEEEKKEGDEVLTPAVKTDEGVFSGQKRHNEIVLDQARNGVDATAGERGFLYKGKFIDRAEAARIYEEQTGRKPANSGELHSEDLLDSGYFKKGEKSVSKNQKFPQAPTPERFDTLEDVLKFKQQRLSEEHQLYRQEIGLSADEATKLQAIMARDGSTEKFEKEPDAGKTGSPESFLRWNPFQ